MFEPLSTATGFAKLLLAPNKFGSALGNGVNRGDDVVDGNDGITDASTTRKLSMPSTRRSLSTAAATVSPVAHVPVGWSLTKPCRACGSSAAAPAKRLCPRGVRFSETMSAE